MRFLERFDRLSSKLRAPLALFYLSPPRDVLLLCLREVLGVTFDCVRGAVSSDDLVNDAIFLGFNRRHVPVSVGVQVYLPHRLPGALGHDSIQVHFVVHDLFGLDLQVHGSSLCSTKRLVDHDASVRHTQTLPLGPCTQQKSTHGSRKAETHGRDVCPAHVHCVVDAKTCSDRASRRVDEHSDVLGWVQAIHEEELRNNRICREVVHLPSEEDNPLLEQQREGVPRKLLGPGRDGWVACPPHHA
mmetsp:Transcript_13264/g.33288  ORF Transcript_13264/g.33288 Transcript_13264/m.33288 type:complete len:244 (-) Transcript_13264:199-930(-)